MKKLSIYRQKILAAGITMGGSVCAFAEGDVSTSFTALQTSILAVIAAAAAMGVTLMVASLGWDVGMGLFKKFTKKGAR